jgi:hypothetical protein
MWRRTALPVAVLALLVPSAFAAAAAKPTLQATSIAPLTIRGTGFKAGETVRAILTRNRARFVHVVHAGSGGSFTARFPLVAVEPCRTLTVRAVGSKGSTARYAYRCRPRHPVGP